VGFVCSSIRIVLPSMASTPACHPVTDAFALGPQPIVIRPMQAAPSFVDAAARWLCKPPVHVTQAQPATNALDCFGGEQRSRKRVQSCHLCQRPPLVILLAVAEQFVSDDMSVVLSVNVNMSVNVT
jgi:hypothetical protein